MNDTYTSLGPECFTNGDVISYKGENYYRACNAWVYDHLEGGSSFCVKRVHHGVTDHEAHDGTTRPQDYDALVEEGRRLAVERETLIARGVEPIQLMIPLFPEGDIYG